MLRRKRSEHGSIMIKDNFLVLFDSVCTPDLVKFLFSRGKKERENEMKKVK